MTIAASDQSPPLWKSWWPVYLGWCVIFLFTRWTSIVDYQMGDPDDFMRMVQIRDWMAGQSWFDVTQYRLNLPDGASMHWSRYVDVPIRAIIELLTPFTGQYIAEISAMVIVPLALLGFILFAVYRATLALTGDWKIALIATALVPTNLLIFIQTLPMRVDHHSWQIAMAAISFWAMVDAKIRRGPEIVGIALAFWMHVSFEGLPYVVLAGLIYGLFYFTERDRSLPRYLLALTAASAFFLITTRSFAELPIVYCDAVSWPLIVSLVAVTATVWFGDHMRQSPDSRMRLLTMAIAGIIGALLFLGNGQSCALNPFGELEPLVRDMWYEEITEGLDIRSQKLLMAVIIVMISVIGILGSFIGWKQQTEAEQKKRWLIQLLIVTSTFLIALKVMRAAAVAEISATIGIALLTHLLISKIMAWRFMVARVLASVFVAFALSPVNALLLGAIIDPASVTMESESKDSDKGEGENHPACDLKQLADLPKMYLFTNMGISPSILLRTHHSSYTSGYHRSHSYMNRNIAAFIGTEPEAKAIIMASGVDHVLFCSNQMDFARYIKVSPNGFAAQLESGNAPDWLEPAPGMQPNQLWKVKRPVTPSSDPI
jgi:hypothetical protein